MSPERDDEQRKRTLRARAAMHRAAAATDDMTAATIDATASVRRLVHVVREGQENDFMELWVRYDDSLDPEPRPWKANKHEYIR